MRIVGVSEHSKTPPAASAWKQAVAEHRKPVLRSSVWQLANSLIPYLALWGLMIWTLSISYWITLALAVVAAGFLVRIWFPSVRSRTDSASSTGTERS